MPLKAVATYLVSNVDKVPSAGELPVRLCNYTDVYKNEFITPAIDLMRATATEQEIAKFQLHVGDVVITKDSESWDDIAVPALVTETADDLVCGYHLAILRPDPAVVLGRFLFRCLQSRSIRLQLELAATGVTRFGLPKDEIGRSLVPIPPVNVQREITQFIDEETVQIDALIAEKQCMLALLDEKRAGVISQAVTRGLDPDAPRRSSGIDWLGEIPAHWRIRRLKHLSPEITVGIVVTPAKYYEDTGVPCLRSLNVTEEGLSANNLVYISPESNEVLNKSQVFTEDLLVVRSGQPGTAAVVDERFDGANCIDLIIIRRSRDLDSSYLAAFLNSWSARTQFRLGSGGAIQQHFNIEMAGNLYVLVPPLREQQEISHHVARVRAENASIVSALQRSIDLLDERRGALIAAAVTGKIALGTTTS